MQMIMLVLDDPDRLDAVVDAWQSVGVSGVTMMETMGAYRRERQRVTGRYVFGLSGLAQTAGRSQFTLFAIVRDQATADLCLEATERIVGDLTEPNTGVFASWHLTSAKGVPEQVDDTKAEK